MTGKFNVKLSKHNTVVINTISIYLTVFPTCPISLEVIPEAIFNRAGTQVPSSGKRQSQEKPNKGIVQAQSAHFEYHALTNYSLASGRSTVISSIACLNDHPIVCARGVVSTNLFESLRSLFFKITENLRRETEESHFILCSTCFRVLLL